MKLLKKNLIPEHSSKAISERLEGKIKQDYLGDFVLGAIDGCVTTFAVVAGVAGSGLPKSIAIILGVSNLIADGFSMAAGNYQSAQSDVQLIEKVRKVEARHIEEVPEGEREEVRQIYKKKGFQGETLENIVETITDDKELWIDTMVTEEFGLQLESSNPLRSALSTFTAFILVGLIPLIPFFIPIDFSSRKMFSFSAISTGIAFFIIGTIKGKMVHRPILRSGIETLIIGGSAASIAYFVGYFLQGIQH